MSWLLSVALAAEPSETPATSPPVVGAIIRPEVVVDIPAFDPINDLPYEHKYEQHTWARAFARGETPRGNAWFFEGRLQYHALLGKDVNDNVGLAPEGWYALTLGETGWDGKIAGPVRLRVGALNERWGKLDLLPIADILAAKDQRVGFTTPPDWQRLPTPMAILSISSERVRSETLLIPLPTSDLMWLRDSDWSLVRQGWIRNTLQDISGIGNPIDRDWEVGDLADVTLNTATTTLAKQTPQFRRQLDAALLSRDLPEALLYNAEFGQRFEFSARNLDVGIFGGYFRSRQAESKLSPFVQNIIAEQKLPEIDADDIQGLQELSRNLQDAFTVTWPRTVVVGADGAALVGPFQIRAETMWQSARVVRAHYLGADSAPNLGVGLGLDYARGSNFGISLEGRWMHLFTDGLDIDPSTLMFSLPDQFQVAGGVRWSILNERVMLQFGGLYDISYQEYMAAGPLLAWRASDSVLFELGGVVLHGFKTPPPRDLIDSMTYKGGIGSYWSQNDALSFAVTFIQ